MGASKRSMRRGMSRYKKARLWAEQLFLERTERYIFPGGVGHRMPRYRWKRLDMIRSRKYFRLKISSREVEKAFQFRKPFRGKAGFRISTYHPKFGLIDDVNENSVEMIPVTDSVRDLKGMVARPEKAVSLDEMDQVIRESTG